MNVSSTSGLRRDESGATVVEFTVVFFFLVLPLILFGMQLMLSTFIRQQATAGARDGARSGIVGFAELDNKSSSDSIRVQQAVRSRLAFEPTLIEWDCAEVDGGGNIPPTKIPCKDALPGEDRVVVSVTMNPIRVVGPFGIFLDPLLPDEITSSASQIVVTKGETP